MEWGKRAKNLFKPGQACAWIAGLMLCASWVQATSLETFGLLYAQVTNDLALHEQGFDGSPESSQQLAILTHARSLLLNADLPDEQALARLVPLLAPDTNYQAVIDGSAFNARAGVLARYAALGTRIGDLPPWSRATTARVRFAGLADDYAALTNAPQAVALASLLASFVEQMDTVAKYEVRAQVMPRPHTRKNSIRAVVNGDRFRSTASGRHSPNFFEVTAPGDFYRAVVGRGVDGAGVIHFQLPVLTSQVRYEVASGLAAVGYSPDVFATNVLIGNATNGTFFVQTDRREVYGVFTCEGPGFEIKDGRFRIQLPRELRD